MPNAKLPEETTYQDTGCDYWQRCQSCPLMPNCRFDYADGLVQVLGKQIKGMRSRGYTAHQIADMLRVPKGMVYQTKGGNNGN